MSLQQTFGKIGGKFITSEFEMAKRLKKISCFVFDWDGVFNRGVKNKEIGSPFSEPDSMGVNMLRFSYWLKNGSLPLVAIITGENNQTALGFAEREHFDYALLKAKNKVKAFELLHAEKDISFKETAFVFDDILDLGLAEKCSLRFGIKRTSSPMFEEFCTDEKLVDYISGHSGGENAVREVSELLIGLIGNFEKTIKERMQFSASYQDYLKQRNAIELVKKEC